MKNLSTIAQALANEISAQDWTDAPYRIDGARHDRNFDRTTSRQLSPEEGEYIRLNVMWVAGQALQENDPNFDIHTFAEACGVPRQYRIGRDGKPSGIIKYGLRPVGATYTPIQLAHLLGYDDEARPGKVVRDYLRATYPDHQKHKPWLLSEEEAADVLANVPRKR